MSFPFLSGGKDGVRLSLHIQPNAARTEAVGIYRDRLKLRVHAPPVDGKANDEIVAFLAKTFGVPKSTIALIAGASSRGKVFEIKGLTAEQAARRLESLMLE